jgi:AcrR family transcriptional regulator
MKRRAEQVDKTRLRITEAAVRLHTTVGPSATSIAGVAEEAGVTRLTVYRHFADLDELFMACTAHWTARNPPPDAGAWGEIPDLEPRARRAFGELYGWYHDHADDLYPIYRDMDSMPLTAQRARAAENRRLAAAIVAGDADNGPDRDRRLQFAVARHLVRYPSWRSLAIEQELDHPEVVELAVRLVMSVSIVA